MNWIDKGQDLAHRAHDSIKQIRKYTLEPYWVHTDEVSQMGYDALIGFYDKDIVEQAVGGYHLHDYREDVVTELLRQGRLEELAAFEAEYNQFPELSRVIVIDLTDVFVKEVYPKMNRSERKHNERERIGKTHVLSKTGKLADLISNTKSIVAHDPDFARTYLKEKLALLPYLADGSSVLLQQATMQCIAGFTTLGLRIPMMTNPSTPR